MNSVQIASMEKLNLDDHFKVIGYFKFRIFRSLTHKGRY